MNILSLRTARGNSLNLIYSWSDQEPFVYYEHNNRDCRNCARISRHKILTWYEARELVQSGVADKLLINNDTLCRLCLETQYDKSWLYCKECNSAVCHLRCMKNYIMHTQTDSKCPGCNAKCIRPTVKDWEPTQFVPCNMDPVRVKPRLH